ncbi:uncharacterized protein CDAR_533841 [Caerostris darwini]|uniref:Apple domain-containing protein n=1 Tax=Caerostris darwini TaxID=1538125 RepID=A0AAV4S8J5_9ARAC|nr:uncharacterized protein CDAR_533841 [Caerostris darwini]
MQKLCELVNAQKKSKITGANNPNIVRDLLLFEHVGYTTLRITGIHPRPLHIWTFRNCFALKMYAPRILPRIICGINLRTLEDRFQSIFKMRSLLLLPFLACLCASVHAQCDLTGKKFDLAFPNIEEEGYESYQMSVEYTLPDAQETIYYKEYYDILEKRGRVEAHQSGKTLTYVYKTETWEAWEISDQECKLKNVTGTPEIAKAVQDDWLYLPPGNPERRTFGPSSMFKVAFDAWNSTDRDGKMAYMGPAEQKIRGLNAQYWRRCDGDKSYVDYFFTVDKDETPFGLSKLKKVPLRVFFGGERSTREKAFVKQEYDIITFQPYISLDARPFQLPVGKGCRRGPLAAEDAPKIPDFSNKNLRFNAEVIYRKIDFSGEDTQYWSYYSTLFMALDVSSQHISYHYTPWNTSSTTTDEPDVKAPEYVIYDMKHGYAYTYNLEDGQCTIIREKTFSPMYELPEGAGAISLTDESILYPNDELTYITEGVNRGLKVNVFEEIVEGYILNKKDKVTQIPKAIISHSYLQNDIVERNTASVKNSLTQVQLRFSGRYEKIIEILTFNFFGLTTELRNKRSIFNIKRCFKNDDDYVWVTLGFPADENVLKKIQDDVPSIQANILNDIKSKSELNAVRIPIIQVDIRDALYVTLLILGKPPVMLDYLKPEEGKKVTGSTELEGMSDVETCANKCLEEEGNCWGFSMCGAVCTYGASSTAGYTNAPGCQLYRRYNNNTFIPSKEQMVQYLKRDVESGQIKLMLRDDTNKDDVKMVQLDATSIQITEPGEDDRLFNRIGNEVNPRMRVLKTGYKLKPSAGAPIKNMGKLRYDECQRLCVDFKECETMSYCLTTSECFLSKSYADDIKDTDMLEDNMCNVLTRKYVDNFNRSPGNVLTLTAKEVLGLDTAEKCARACLTKTEYKCLSFDHCPSDEKAACKLHTVHYPNSKTREGVQTNSSNCGHYYRKFSTEFRKNLEKQSVGSKLAPINNLTLEECAKNCIEYGKGTCYGYDFCQGSTILATTCTLLDSDPSTIKLTYKSICTNYMRDAPQAPQKPYTNGYAAGIGILCFIVGGVVGALIVFGIAYLRVNRR